MYKKFYICKAMQFLRQHINSIKKLCKENNVHTLFAFGSVVTDQFSDNSDVDFVVDIQDQDPISYADKYFNLKFQLEKLLNRSVDLLESKSIKNKYLKSEIERTKILIYGKRSPKLA